MTINSIKCYFDRYDCQCWQPRVVGVTNIFGCHLVSGLSFYWISWSIWGHGRRAQRKGQETSVRMPDPVCSFPGRPTRVPNNSVFCNWSNQIPASWRDGVRAHRAFLPGTSANWEGEVTIQISAHFGYNNNTIRIQRTVLCQSGNTRGRRDACHAWDQVTHTPNFHAEKN